jgi:predicted N-acetyltransferase YhbS
MNVILRAGELENETEALLGLFQCQLSPLIDRRRVDWLYRHCPHGPAMVWVASETDSGKLVGAAAVFPRRIMIAGKLENGFVLGDFCVSAEHRSLGLAVRLQRRCLEEVEHGSFVAGYDLPSNTMLAVYDRLGRQPSAHRMVRLVKKLRAENWIAKKLKSRIVARLLSPAANTILKLQRGSLRLRSGVSVELQEGRLGQEYTVLARSVGDGLGTCVERSAEYLNWRYLDHPANKYHILAARRGSKLEGYLVFQREVGSIKIVDWFGQEPVELRKDLIRGLIKLLQSDDCESVQASVLTSHAYHNDLCSLGFHPREFSPVMFLGAAARQSSSATANGSWLLMDGDRES